MVFVKNHENIYYIISYLNSSPVKYLLDIFNPTASLQVSDVLRLPFVKTSKENNIIDKTVEKINIAHLDWDSSELSHDFQMNSLLQAQIEVKNIAANSENCAGSSFLSLSEVYLYWRHKWLFLTQKMYDLEIENNRIFIEACGLEDELSPSVLWNEITLTCNPWYRYGKTPENSNLLGNSFYLNVSTAQVHPTFKQEADCPAGDFPFAHETEQRLLEDTIKEFISYAVGCMMGRYSLEKPGLILANQGEDFDDYIAKVRAGTEKQNEQETVRSGFLPDRDGVLPILDDEWFVDDIVAQFKDFLKFTFGEEAFSRNLAFIEKAIGKDIRKYFMKDFYKEHVQRYKKRPIYWLFSSPKGSFNALIYLHRYRPDTVSIVLNDYLREFMTKLRVQRNHLIDDNNRADLSASEKSANLKRIDTYAAMLAELEDYERDILFPLAQKQLAIDLDDGVKVNYLKFGAALKEIPGLKAREE